MVAKAPGEPTPQVTLEDLRPREIDLDLLVVGDNPRSDATEETDKLAKSIREHGVITPIQVRPLGDGKFQIVAGERRYNAARMAKLKTIPAVARVIDDTGAYVQSLVENLQRKDLNPLDEARAFQQLISEHKMTQEALGKQVGKSQPYIANSLGLLDLAPEVQEQVQAGTVTVGHAKAIRTLPAERQVALATQIVEKKTPVAEISYLVRREKDESERADRYADAKQKSIDEAIGIIKGARINKARVIVFHSTDLAEAVKEAGWSATPWDREQYTQEPKYKDECDGLLYDQYGPADKSRLRPICLVKAHYEAYRKVENAKADEERKEQEKIVKEARKLLATKMSESGSVLPTRLILYMLLGDPTVSSYGGSNEATKFMKRHKGDVTAGFNGLWDVVAGLEPGKVVKETIDLITGGILYNVFSENARYENARTFRVREWLVNTAGLDKAIVWGGHEPPTEEDQDEVNAVAAEEMGVTEDEYAAGIQAQEAPTEKRERDPAQIQDQPGEEDKAGPSTEGNPELTPAEEAAKHPPTQ